MEKTKRSGDSRIACSLLINDNTGGPTPTPPRLLEERARAREKGVVGTGRHGRQKNSRRLEGSAPALREAALAVSGGPTAAEISQKGLRTTTMADMLSHPLPPSVSVSGAMQRSHSASQTSLGLIPCRSLALTKSTACHCPQQRSQPSGPFKHSHC